MDEKMLKACIMSCKGGIPLNELNNEYKELVGEDIVYDKSKYKSLSLFLTSLPGICVKGNHVTCSCEETKHIQSLISKQKSNGKRRKFIIKKPNNSKLQLDDGFVPRSEKRLNKQFSLSQNSISEFGPVNGSSILEDHLNNLSFDDYHCLYCERNQIFNLMYSLCSLLSKVDEPLNLLEKAVSNNYYRKKAVINNINRQKCSPKRSNGRNTNLLLYGLQVVGDDFMLDLAYSMFSISHKLHFTTCALGQSLNSARYNLVKQPCTQEVLIFCGLNDLYKGASTSVLIDQMQELILCVLLMGAKPIVINFPPSPIRWVNHIIKNFNCWLMTLGVIEVIDVFSKFHGRNYNLQANLFEREAVYVKGVQHYMWSRSGLELIKQCIAKAVSKRNNDSNY